MKQVINIEGMSCNHCVARVEEALAPLEGMKKVKVNFKKGQAVVKYDEQLLNETTLVSTVNDLGFKASV
ncbi:copper chaperone CopZ [Vagococcus zengguangii]|uniref:Copper chaperone CopZ n=1 Tax=Vagococcus zengguangii TaxID=2571750 RepID=A0A4D7CTP2_9ENTE|nr:copper chaperone CopZ [Vagococcus zengguangii]QCI86272.1 copper chaperone CopZ [Vagococcus zengguangii]